MKRGRKKCRSPLRFTKQPRIAKVVKLIGRKRGISAAEAAKILSLHAASIRAVISRLAEAGINVERTWIRGRGLVYRPH